MQRWTLFLVGFWVFPLPLLGLEGMLVPAARYAQLAVTLTVLVVLEGAGGKVGSLWVLLWLHAAGYGALLFLGAYLMNQAILSRMPRRIGFGIVSGLVVVLLVWGVVGTPYDTSFHHTDAHASILRLYR